MYEAIEGNVRATWLLFAAFVVVVGTLGYVFGELIELGYVGAVAAAVLAVLAAWASYYHSDRLVLAISGAREAPRDRYPYLRNTVEGLAIAAGIPTPRLYLIDDTAPNAFATGRDPDHAVIVVTTGLLDKLDRLELEGVIAHEMAHIQNYDIRLATIAAVLVGTVALMSDWLLRSMRFGRRRGGRDGGGGGLIVLAGLVLAILAPLAAQLLRLAISRRREYLADASGAMLTRYPEGLASALEQIAADPEPLEAANKATAHLYIINPLHEWGGPMNSLFNTHPPVEERVRRLRDMTFEGRETTPVGRREWFLAGGPDHSPEEGSVRVLLAALLAGSLVVTVGITGRAEAAPQAPAHAVYQVQAGDTLWRIARQHGTRPEHLATLNGIPIDGVLSIGRRLRVPAGSTPPAALRPAASRPAPGPSASRPVPAVYRVRQGDTLWNIARRHGTTPARLAALNGMAVDGVLPVGRALKVPAPAAGPQPAQGAAAPPAQVIEAQRARLAALPSRGAQWMDDLLALSRRYLGVRYRWGGTTPAGFDCSGFMYYVFGRVGVTLPRTTFAMFDSGAPVPREALQSGDIVFFETVSPGPSHAGIYLGDGRFIHAASGAGRVLVTSMDDGYYAPRFLGARRF